MDSPLSVRKVQNVEPCSNGSASGDVDRILKSVGDAVFKCLAEAVLELGVYGRAHGLEKSLEFRGNVLNRVPCP